MTLSEFTAIELIARDHQRREDSLHVAPTLRKRAYQIGYLEGLRAAAAYIAMEQEHARTGQPVKLKEPADGEREIRLALTKRTSAE